MWIKGYKDGVGFWYVLWGRKGTNYNMDAYMTFIGLANWFRRKAYSEVPVVRVGRMVATEDGFDEKEHWTSREEFIKWARPLVSFPLP